MSKSKREAKVREILNQARPYLESEGVEIAFRELRGDVAVLSMTASKTTCASNIVTLRLCVQQRILSQMDSIEQVEVE